MGCNTANFAATTFIKLIDDIKNKAFEEIVISSKRKPWATTSIINAIRKKYMIHMKIRKHADNFDFKNYYFRYRNITTNMF